VSAPACCGIVAAKVGCLWGIVLWVAYDRFVVAKIGCLWGIVLWVAYDGFVAAEIVGIIDCEIGAAKFIGNVSPEVGPSKPTRMFWFCSYL